MGVACGCDIEVVFMIKGHPTANDIPNSNSNVKFRMGIVSCFYKITRESSTLQSGAQRVSPVPDKSMSYAGMQQPVIVST